MNEHGRESRTDSEREERRRKEDAELAAGRKGGAASMAVGAPATAVRGVAAIPFTRDLARWSSIWAGLLIALPIQLILSAIGLAIALRSYNPAAADYGTRVSSMVGIWSAISLLIALFVGGYIAGRLAAVSGVKNGVFQATVVWALAVLFTAWLGTTGATGVASMMLNNTSVQGLAARSAGLPPQQVANMAATASSGAWWFVIGSVLAWVTAAVGGALGGSARIEEVREEV